MAAPSVQIFPISNSSPTKGSAMTTRSFGSAVIPGSGSTVLASKAHVYTFTGNSGSELRLYISTNPSNGIQHPYFVSSVYTDPASISSATIQSWATLGTSVPVSPNISDVSAGADTQYIYSSIIIPSTATSGNNVQRVIRLQYYYI